MKHGRLQLSLLAIFLTASLSCRSSSSVRPAAVPAGPGTPVAAGARDTHEQLEGVLWMQTSAEYWALASSTYAQARHALDVALADRAWTAATEQQGDFGALPPAIILDVDETVLDNSRFQGRMIRENKFYDGEVWSAWVAARAATAIPGAVEFLKYAAQKNVRVFFVTNRAAADEPATIDNLRQAGFDAGPDTVLVVGENGWTSDKSGRRSFIAQRYRILALFGDDLNDFLNTAALNTPQRLEAAKSNAAKWGTRWFLLPNPLYGSFDRSLYPGITDDAQILARKRALVSGF
jgi:acid phosphatase